MARPQGPRDTRAAHRAATAGRIAIDDDGYELRPLDLSPEGVADIARLLGEVFPKAHHLTPAYIDWLYNRNPVGAAVGTNAYREGRAVGHYVTVPVRARLLGGEALGVHSLNGAVHPDHQGRRLYARLGEATHARLAADGWEFVVGVPNQNSTHVFVRTWGFQLVCALGARVGVGALPRGDDGAPLDYERVWEPDVVRWRLANPSVTYDLRRRAGRCEVRAATGRPGILALLGSVDEAAAGGAPSRRRHGLFDLFIGVDPALRFRQGAWWNVPLRLRPAPLNFIFKDLCGEDRRVDAERLRFHALDFDAY